MNPADFERFDIDMIWGVPVVADECVEGKLFRLDCDGSAFGIEEVLEGWDVKPADGWRLD